MHCSNCIFKRKFVRKRVICQVVQWQLYYIFLGHTFRAIDIDVVIQIMTANINNNY